ncbi:uncharacterized protein LOC132455285 [Gadus macrocephalus]|uniref:uncharacterized protein LOC132455285 n=1 Tax=Gadus macrocephalus TaxID=80720 RepID=UPI0028CB462D|nr:uncharacterized protein LOC132455285 [Gadus macrocephalus]
MLNMGAVLLLLIGVTDGVKTFCDATQPNIATQCFGCLGGTLEVQLPKTSQDDTYRLMKKSDNSTYSMDVHDAVGQEVERTTCYLTIQAPVSSPLLSRECLYTGQQRVSGSAEGGGALHYSFSLDGLPLNGTRLLSGPSGTSGDVTLEPGRSGLLNCSVRNNVSHAAANITLSVCGDHISIIARPLTVGLLFLVALGVYWALKKKKTSRHRDIALSSMAVDDGVPYVNVSGATGRAGGE